MCYICLLIWYEGSKLQQQLTKAKDAVRKFRQELEKMTPTPDCMFLLSRCIMFTCNSCHVKQLSSPMKRLHMKQLLCEIALLLNVFTWNSHYVELIINCGFVHSGYKTSVMLFCSLYPWRGNSCCGMLSYPVPSHFSEHGNMDDKDGQLVDTWLSWSWSSSIV